MTCDERKDLLGLYATDALEPEERSDLRAHLLSGCPACNGYLTEVESILALLPLGLTPVVPSPEVKTRLLERISSGRASPGHSENPLAQRKWFGRMTDAFIGGAIAAGIGALAVGLMHDRDRQAIDALKTQVARHDEQLGALQSSMLNADQTLQSLKPPAILMVSAEGTTAQPDAFARVFIDKPRGTLHLYAASLKPPGEGKTYELWLINDKSQKIPAGLFDVNRHGEASLERSVPADAGHIVAVAVTDEPKAGVPQPTGTIQILGKVQ